MTNSTDISFDDHDDYDYGSEHVPAPTNAAMAKLHEKVDLAAKAEDYIAALKEKLKTAERRYKDLTETEIPAILIHECGLKECTTPQGVYVKVDTKWYASIPAMSTVANEKDPERRKELQTKRETAIAWLEANNHSDIIKRKFEIEFNKEDTEWANRFRADLGKRKKPLPVKEGEDVNFQTLSALVREMKKNNDYVPEEILGAHERTSVTIKRK